MKVSRSRVLMFSRIALRHAVQDAPYGALPVLLAARSAELGLSSAQIGLAITLYATVSALLQPAFGHLSDRLPLRWLTTAATFWTSSFVALAAIAPSYPLLATAVAVAGLGSAAFHPLGAAEATASGGEHRQATATSVFFLGASMGMAVLGSAVGGLLIDTWGPRGLFLLAAFIWIVSLLLYQRRETSTPVRAPAIASATPQQESGPEPMRWIWRLGMIGFVVAIAIRATTYQVFNAYIPLLYEGWGYSPASYGFMASLFLLGDALGGPIGSHLADRLGIKGVLGISLLATAPPLLGFLILGGAWAGPLLVVAGLFHGPSHTLLLVSGQRLLPKRRALASGLVLGFTFASGSMFSWVAGIAADRFGLHLVLQRLAILPALGAIFAFAALTALARPARTLRESTRLARAQDRAVES